MSSGDQRLANMQSLLTTHIGLCIGAITTINIILTSKILSKDMSHYVVISLIIYSFISILTGVGEYIEKFHKLHKDCKDNKNITLSNWDYTMSTTYLVIGIMMILVNIFSCISIVKYLRN